MARIKIEVAGKKLFSAQMSVRITDINYGNHTGNDALVGILHEARALWLRENGFTELDIDGTGLILSDLVVNFKRESFYGDLLEIDLYADEVTSKSFELIYIVKVSRDEALIEIAAAKTTMISYDYQKKKVISMPKSLENLVS